MRPVRDQVQTVRLNCIVETARVSVPIGVATIRTDEAHPPANQRPPFPRTATLQMAAKTTLTLFLRETKCLTELNPFTTMMSLVNDQEKCQI